jgi:hypothetical protein
MVGILVTGNIWHHVKGFGMNQIVMAVLQFFLHRFYGFRNQITGNHKGMAGKTGFENIFKGKGFLGPFKNSHFMTKRFDKLNILLSWGFLMRENKVI